MVRQLFRVRIGNKIERDIWIMFCKLIEENGAARGDSAFNDVTLIVSWANASISLPRFASEATCRFFFGLALSTR